MRSGTAGRRGRTLGAWTLAEVLCAIVCAVVAARADVVPADVAHVRQVRNGDNIFERLIRRRPVDVRITRASVDDQRAAIAP